jgi:hypothetical protein
MRDYAQIFGTHVEGDYTSGGIGIQITGYGCNIVIPRIVQYETGLQIGDGTATYSHAYNAQIGFISGNASTTCIKVTAGAIRFGTVETILGTCGAQIVDARASSDGVYGSCNLQLQDYFTAAPTTGHWVVGVYARNAGVAVGKPQGWICTAAGTPGTWSEVGYVGTVVRRTVARTIDLDDDARMNSGATMVQATRRSGSSP